MDDDDGDEIGNFPGLCQPSPYGFSVPTHPSLLCFVILGWAMYHFPIACWHHIKLCRRRVLKGRWRTKTLLFFLLDFPASLLASGAFGHTPWCLSPCKFQDHPNGWFQQLLPAPQPAPGTSPRHPAGGLPTNLTWWATFQCVSPAEAFQQIPLAPQKGAPE